MEIRSRYEEVPLDLVDPNPNQPRQHFDESRIKKLADSIRENTMLQPVTVRAHPKRPGRYMIISGERRFRALKQNGIQRTIVKVYEGADVSKSYILSAIENIQRENLNPIDEAVCYRRMHDEEHLTWEQVADVLGKTDVTAILSKIKLLTLPPEIQERVRMGTLPQVTALNLSHHQNDDGVYMRMAHDLIAGRDPAEAHFRKETVRGQLQVQAKLPKSPEDFARRIVKLSGHVQSMPAVLEAFLKLPTGEQIEVFEAIHYSVRGKLRVRFVALYRAIQAVSERMNAFDAHHTGRGPALEDVIPSDSIPLAVKPVAVTPAPVPKPIHLSVPPTSPPAVRKPQATVSAGGNAHETSHSNGDGDTQSWDLSTRVLSALFYSGGHINVNLSRSGLEETIHNHLPNGADVDAIVTNTIHAAKLRWRTTPKGDETERHFTRLVTQFRRDYGDPPNFNDALTKAIQQDRSGDPVLERV